MITDPKVLLSEQSKNQIRQDELVNFLGSCSEALRLIADDKKILPANEENYKGAMNTFLNGLLSVELKAQQDMAMQSALTFIRPLEKHVGANIDDVNKKARRLVSDCVYGCKVDRDIDVCDYPVGDPTSPFAKQKEVIRMYAMCTGTNCFEIGYTRSRHNGHRKETLKERRPIYQAQVDLPRLS
jgi:hypothetical protein